MKRYATVDTGLPCFFASDRSVESSVSVSITATRLRRAFGEGPLPEPLGRPAPGLRPPQVPFFFVDFLVDLRAAMPSPIEDCRSLAPPAAAVVGARSVHVCSHRGHAVRSDVPTRLSMPRSRRSRLSRGAGASLGSCSCVSRRLHGTHRILRVGRTLIGRSTVGRRERSPASSHAGIALPALRNRQCVVISSIALSNPRRTRRSDESSSCSPSVQIRGFHRCVGMG